MQQDTFVKERSSLVTQTKQEEDTIDLLELFMGLLTHWTIIASTAGGCRADGTLYFFSGNADVQGNSYHLCGQPR